MQRRGVLKRFQNSGRFVQATKLPVTSPSKRFQSLFSPERSERDRLNSLYASAVAR